MPPRKAEIVTRPDGSRFVRVPAGPAAPAPASALANVSLSMDAAATAGIAGGLAVVAAAVDRATERIAAALDAVASSLAKVQPVVNVSPTPLQVVVSPTPVTFAPQVIAQAGKQILENRLTVDANVLLPMRQERKAVVKDASGKVIETIVLGGA